MIVIVHPDLKAVLKKHSLHLLIKEIQCKDANWLENLENAKIFNLLASCGCSMTDTKENCVLYSLKKKKNSSFSGCSHVGLLFTNEEQKKVGSAVFDTPATHTHLVYDITDTDCHSCQPLFGVKFRQSRVCEPGFPLCRPVSFVFC